VVAAWAKERAARSIDPIVEVQREAGPITNPSRTQVSAMERIHGSSRKHV